MTARHRRGPGGGRSIPPHAQAAETPSSEAAIDYKTSAPSASPFVESPALGERRLWAPTFETAVSLLILPRVLSALLNPIADCDETFNYWEPLHYLLYGFGFQTWEYSPLFALRSYLYLLVHGALARLATWGFAIANLGGDAALSTSKILVFYGVRGVLGLICAYAEALFYRASLRAFGRRTARYLLVLLFLNAGLFHASTALLPSTTVMYLLMLVTTAWIDGSHALAVFYGVVAVLCGWPYVGVLFIPFLLDTLYTRGFVVSLAMGIILGGVVLAAELSANFVYYQRLVLPAWNIVRYNVLSNETDSTLYGTEPLGFYLRNLVLNFNVAVLMAAPAGLVVVLLPRATTTITSLRRFLYLSPLYIWLVIMFSQAHKEERFLFPVYPLILLAAAITLSVLVHHLHGAFPSTSRYRWLGVILSSLIVHATLGLYGALSVSRIVSNVVNYSAPLRVYYHLHEHILPSVSTGLLRRGSDSTRPVHVCIGKEWYRFPTSFFIPSNATTVRFLESSFRGQLPGHFAPLPNGTWVIPEDMNDKNREEPSRYVAESECDYVIDLELPTQQETKYWEASDDWERVHVDWFLNAEASSSPYRSFYIPFMSTEPYVQFAKYAIYKSYRRRRP